MSLTLTWCPTCGKADWGDGRHRCPPMWEVERAWDRKGVREWEECNPIRAESSVLAAEAWADRHDSNGDYTIVRGSEETVRVRPLDSDEEWSVFTVTGESVPEYTAHEVSPLAQGIST